MKKILTLAIVIILSKTSFAQGFSYSFGLGVEWSFPSTREETPLNKNFLPQQKGQLLKIVSNSSLFYYLKKDADKEYTSDFFFSAHFCNTTINSVLNIQGADYEQLSEFLITSLHGGLYNDRKTKNEHRMRTQISGGLEYGRRVRSEGDFSGNYFSKNLLGFGFEWSNTLYRKEQKMPIGWGFRMGGSFLNLNGFKKQNEHEGYVYSNIFVRVLF
jgi:hypothetical protein